MTESEVLKIFEDEVIILDCWIEHCKDIIADCETEEDEFDDDKERAELSLRDYTEKKEAFDVAISALKEIQLYKDNKLCLIPEDVYSKQCEELDAYKEIGTVEEIKLAKRYIDLKRKCGNPANTIDLCAEYVAIGTVEECREAVEKQKAKNPVKDKYHHNCCPNCGWIVSGEGGYGEEFCPHCENCGQAIRWVNENLEGMEDE